MSHLHYHHSELLIEKVKLTEIAKQYGTPCYIYSRHAIETNWRMFDEAFAGCPHRICYAVKANSNIAILNLLAGLGSHFDIVSIGELERVIAAGGKADQMVFSGVGKNQTEIDKAVELGIFCIDVESEGELTRLHQTALKYKKKIPIALRINPNIDPETHAYISTGLKENKFGIEIDKAIQLCQKIALVPTFNLIGIACHIGSQITDLEPFSSAIDSLLIIYHHLQRIGISIHHLNIGGGLGITYQHEQPPSIQSYAHMLCEKLSTVSIELIIEPGRAITGNAGVLLTRIEYIKPTSEKHFAIVDAGMNDLLRPALYQAWQPISPVIQRDIEKEMYDIAGPICESADFLGKNRELAIEVGDLLVIESAGAYGFSMSSNYNSRPRPPEVLVDGNKTHLIRKRETTHELFASEMIPRCK